MDIKKFLLITLSLVTVVITSLVIFAPKKERSHFWDDNHHNEKDTDMKSSDNRNLSSFNEVELNGAFNVTLHKDSVESIDIKSTGASANKIITSVENGVLKVSLKKGFHLNFSADIVIHYKNIDKIESNGASDIKLAEELTTKKLVVDFSGASNIKGKINVEKVEISLSGAGDVNLSGKATEQTIEISGAGNAENIGLETENTKLEIDGAGDAGIFVKNTFKAEISGAASVKVKGNPKNKDVDISGFGDVDYVK